MAAPNGLSLRTKLISLALFTIVSLIVLFAVSLNNTRSQLMHT